jgi:multicomponent Na+:H+ antiporter subunit E
VRYTISATLTLFAFWLLLSGIFTPLLIALGAASSVGIALYAKRMNLIDREGHPVHLLLAAVTYWPWLFKEIAKSSWDVARVIVHPRLPVSPVFVRVKASQKTVVGIVAYANSITLTPGTLTVDVIEGEILVHAVTREGAAALVEGDMDRRVSEFEGRA